MRPGITISYQDGPTLRQVRVEQFTGDSKPRAFVDAATISFSVAGSSIQTGSTRPSRRVWTIVGYVENDVAFDLEDLYTAWDASRATGAQAVVSVADQTFVRNINNPINATSVFSAAPKIDPVPGSPYSLISFAMTEV